MTSYKKDTSNITDTYAQYTEEVKERWGNTLAHSQSQQRGMKRSKEQLDHIQNEARSIYNDLAHQMQNSATYDSTAVQKLVQRVYTHLHYFYDPSYKIFKGLGQMYVDDPRFTRFFEVYAIGLTQFICDAMIYYADKNLKNN